MVHLRRYNDTYKGAYNSRVAFPLGGIGAGMIALEGTGALSHFSLRNTPDMMNEPLVFSALWVKGEEGRGYARVLEGPVPTWKIFSSRADGFSGPGNGLTGKTYGLPRFAEAQFRARFPFGKVELRDPSVPVEVSITGWSPFIPLNADDSSLPAAGLEFEFVNTTDREIELVYSFHALHFVAAAGSETHRVVEARSGRGFVLDQPPLDGRPWAQGAFCAVTDHPEATVDCAWFRGDWFDPVTMAWKAVASGERVARAPFDEGKPSPGGSLYVPLKLGPRASQTVRLLLSWFVPETNLTVGAPEQGGGVHPKYYKPWYAGAFADIFEVSEYWLDQYDRLRAESERFTESFHASTMPDELVEAAAANLAILKSPTVLRQTDGRIWGWEGCHDMGGSCHGTCTHVWNYAQSLPHLFPELERGIRGTELRDGLDARGHQIFRIPLPIQPTPDHSYHAASDGQLGGVMKIYREWRIGGDTEWLRGLWPKLKLSLDYCIEAWDPERIGVLVEPHHNTYDIEFWGPDGMCSSVYLGALKAASLMAEAIGYEGALYAELYSRGRKYLEEELFNGEYFEQRIVWQGLRAKPPVREMEQAQAEAEELADVRVLGETQDQVVDQPPAVYYSTEAAELLRKEGPKYQYGIGCLSDGVIGAWFAEMAGLGDILDRDKVRSHLLSVYKYNLRRDLSEHANPQRPGYALGSEGGLLLCTWPRGGQLSLPFVYSNEVWTGIEYQVASHLLSLGCMEEGLEIVRICRDRYDGQVRNPFDEYECGHFYARAMASYGLIQGWSGVRYDACERTLYISPRVGGDFSSFLCTAGGYGIAGKRGGEPFFDLKSGEVDIEQIKLLV